MFGDTHVKRTKLAFLFPERDVLMYGDFIEDNGYFHSREGYKEFKVSNFFGYAKPKAKSTILASNLQSDEAWNRYIEEKYGPSENSFPTSLFSDITPKNELMIRFTHSQMRITDENFKHFYVVPNASSKSLSGKNIASGGMYEIENFNEAASYCMLTSLGDNEVISVDRDILDYCTIYVQEKHRKNYSGINNLFKQIYQKNCLHPSPSMLKKLNLWAKEKEQYKFGSYKNYGNIFLNDLRNYLANFANSVEETFITPTNKSVGAQFTTNETGTKEADDFLRSLEMNPENIAALKQFKKDSKDEEEFNVNERMD